MKYNFKSIEKKWQKKWIDKKIFQVKEDKKKKKFYVLEMFPYPSGSFLHMGHVRTYTMGDIIARFKRMNGFNVLYPMGYDSFGLPAENSAKKVGEHPKKYTEMAIEKISHYFKKLGNSYDWSRMISSHKPEYYKWNQFFFLKFFEKDLVYRKKASVNWCDSCNTVLANEEVEAGKCWRCKSEVIEKKLDQWFFRITKYANELLDSIEGLGWRDNIKTLQRNWIGKSHGTEIDFEIIPKGMTSKGASKEKWPIFTTRPDTIYGVTFMVISAQHSKLFDLVTKEQKKEVEKFLKKIKSVSKKSMKEVEFLDKEGVFTGSYAINPVTKGKVPVYVGNFVVADYGSGMVMAVPAHDQRDFEFAKKYGIEVKQVIEAKLTKERAYTNSGKLINSSKFNGLDNEKAKQEITKYLIKENLGRKVVQFKLRDWLISRQRYWGTPIPIVYCEKCGIVPDENLPVLLPEDVDFSGTGNPLLTSKEFLNVKCPKCNGEGRRETDTMGGFMDSSWYFLRFCDPDNIKEPFSKEKVKYWMPVDQYIGEIGFAASHLIYSRFFTKALRDLGYLDFDEPFTKLFNQGTVYKGGSKMSKSSGNAVTQDAISEKYGIDSARLFLMFVASPESAMEWSDKGIEGVYKFIKKTLVMKPSLEPNSRLEHYKNKFVKEITEDIENFKFNLAIVKLMKWGNLLVKGCDKESYFDFLKLLHPFCPHITEELWEKLGNKSFISLEKWPEADLKKVNKKFEEEEKFVEKLKADITNIKKIVGKKNPKVYVYVIPKELELYKNIKGIKVFSISDKDKYDPENKSKKVKLGRPGIYLE